MDNGWAAGPRGLPSVRKKQLKDNPSWLSNASLRRSRSAPQQCLACHTPVAKLHNRGAHRNVNCGSCHTVPAGHTSAPSAVNRPKTRFDYGSCSQCHKEQHKDLFNPKYHYEWAQKKGMNDYSFVRDQDGG